MVNRSRYDNRARSWKEALKRILDDMEPEHRNLERRVLVRTVATIRALPLRVAGDSRSIAVRSRPRLEEECRSALRAAEKKTIAALKSYFPLLKFSQGAYEPFVSGAAALANTATVLDHVLRRSGQRPLYNILRASLTDRVRGRTGKWYDVDVARLLEVCEEDQRKWRQRHKGLLKDASDQDHRVAMAVLRQAAAERGISVS